MDLPANIDIETLPGPVRGQPPALYYRDEIVWSPDRRHFALAYTIFEPSMCNEVGSILIGRLDGERGIVMQNPAQVLASCWNSPWCRWLDDDVLVFKAQRYANKILHMPLVLAHVNDGFRIVAGSNDSAQWIDNVESYSGAAWTPWNEAALVEAIESERPPRAG